MFKRVESIQWEALIIIDPVGEVYTVLLEYREPPVFPAFLNLSSSYQKNLHV